MKREHPLYLSFKESLQNGNIADLDLFKEKTFLEELDTEEKNELASLFLKKAEEGLHQKNVAVLVDASHMAEDLSNEKSDVLLTISTLFYRFGVLEANKDSLLLALGKMIQIEERRPEFYELDYRGSHLWGNLLVAINRVHPDDTFLERAIQKYQKALTIAPKEDKVYQDIHWDLGVAFIRLAVRSKELADYKSALVAFSKAATLNPTFSHFWLDYSEALFQLGIHLGEPNYLMQATEYIRQVISKKPEGDSKVYIRAWNLLALISKKQVELTHGEQELEEADRIFQQALISNPEESSLWLEWGELYLRMGWYQKDISYLDKGLEKLTTLKANECDPTRLSALLSSGLILLGLHLEDLRLIKEGEKRVKTLLSQAMSPFDVLYASGIASFAKGHYFTEEKDYLEALEFLERALLLDPSSLSLRHMIYECGLALGEMKQDKRYFKIAADAISRACSLAPNVPLFWNEWGTVLLKLHFFDKGLLLDQAIDKFKKALFLNPTKPDLKGLFHYGIALDIIGGIMEDEKAYEKAIEVLNIVAEKIPDSLAIRYQLGLSYLHLAEWNGEVENLWRAADLFESIVKQDKEDEGTWCGLGTTLLHLSLQLNDPVEKEQASQLNTRAEVALLHAVELGNGEANYHLACLYSLKGVLEKSMEYLQRARTLHALPSKEDILTDEWLEGVRGTEAFDIFMMKEDEE